MADLLAVGLDLASVHGAVVGQVPGRGVVFQRAVDAPPKSEIDSPVRDLRMAEALYMALARCRYDDLDARGILPADAPPARLLIEHTPFNPHQTGAAQTGVVRGALYQMLCGTPGGPRLFKEVYLVNPSQWRSFHGVTETGNAKWDAYLEHATALGFVPEITATRKADRVKQEQDLVAAFLISEMAADFTGRSADLIKSKPNLRIV